MKRSNRLVLLVGVFLAIVAFVGILLLVRQTPEPTVVVPTDGPVVVAKADIPLSTKIRLDQIEVKTVALSAILPGAFSDPSQVIGQIVRESVGIGAQVTATTLSGGSTGLIDNLTCPLTLRCVSVKVDQLTGVGTVIKTGDYVDMVIGLTGDKFNPLPAVDGVPGLSVKLMLQGMQVMGTLLPPQTDTGVAPSAAPDSGTEPSTALVVGQEQIVILAVTAQQLEVIKFAQLDGNVSLALRSPDDFIDPATGEPLPKVDTPTSGIILKELVTSFGVLPPEVVQTLTPTTP